MFFTFDGLTPTNQYLSPQTSHIVLSHPSLTDQLLLAEHDDKPYENYRVGQTRSNGRSLLGSIRLQGDNWKKDQWECNFIAKSAQVVLFEQLLQAQQDSTLSVTLLDRWIDGVVVSKSVWLEIDRQYLFLLAANSWFRLQFQVLEV